MSIDYSQKIPNNVNLADDRTLQRALEQWQPNFVNWWDDVGPDGSTNHDVYLRTATSVDPQGWAHFDYVKMRDYRWGIFLQPGDSERVVQFGDHKGEKAWQDVPGEHRANLRRIIVTQGDTEPASVEQQRHLGLTAPSLYDLRNLYQINVEEGRHLWAMVYLLQKFFGRDGREEAGALLERTSGDADNPRILGAFNERTPDWLAFFMFTYFTDRDGKFQLAALAESAFDPLARTTRFMLTEEAHHMFVGESGVSRVLQRTAKVMNELQSDDAGLVRAAGAIDLGTVQRYLNFHYSVTIDLFGADQSSNAATFYSTGLKGRYEEGKRVDDHVLKGQTYKVLEVQNGQLVEKEVPMLNALNEVLRDDFIKDSVAGVGRWNKVLEKAGVTARLAVPHKAFNRKIGALAGIRLSPEGRVVSQEEWQAKEKDWLPSPADFAFVASLMGPVLEPGKFAGWIAPPAMGINKNPVDFDYVRFG
ncbi:MAG: benzoyl-CoA 2,3-epoxidase subunit BoxB [Pseudomonadota bacterium]|nr:benzoyl-CoA 2,3-epoxidase subunit BoxB [Pseudomonadota bacterium]